MIENLPRDMLQNILSHFEIQDVVHKIRLVNKNWMLFASKLVQDQICLKREALKKTFKKREELYKAFEKEDYLCFNNTQALDEINQDIKDQILTAYRVGYLWFLYDETSQNTKLNDIFNTNLDAEIATLYLKRPVLKKIKTDSKPIPISIYSSTALFIATTMLLTMIGYFIGNHFGVWSIGEFFGGMLSGTLFTILLVLDIIVILGDGDPHGLAFIVLKELPAPYGFAVLVLASLASAMIVMLAGQLGCFSACDTKHSTQPDIDAPPRQTPSNIFPYASKLTHTSRRNISSVFDVDSNTSEQTTKITSAYPDHFVDRRQNNQKFDSGIFVQLL